MDAWVSLNDALRSGYGKRLLAQPPHGKESQRVTKRTRRVPKPLVYGIPTHRRCGQETQPYAEVTTFYTYPDQTPIQTSSRNEFLAIQEDIHLRIMKVVKQAGTGFAFPSRTLYQTREGGINSERQQAAEKQVREWASAQAWPFPDFAEDDRKGITDSSDYPPVGSPKADRGQPASKVD